MQVQNPDVTQIARDQAKLSVAEGFPQNLLPDIRPILDVTPRHHRNVEILRATTAAGNLYTVPAKTTFYLTNALISGAKAVGDSGTAISMTATYNGATVTLLRAISSTLTAYEQTIVGNWQFHPIKFPSGSVITLGVGGTWGASCAQLQGYEVLDS